MNLNLNKLFQRKNLYKNMDKLYFNYVFCFLHKVVAIGRPFALLTHD